jgi:hypothetical protein
MNAAFNCAAMSHSTSTLVEARCVPFRKKPPRVVQDADRKQDTKLNREDLSLSSRNLPVESLDQCQSVGDPMFFPLGYDGIALYF